MTYRKDLIASLIRDVPDFPEPGVTFKDITRYWQIPMAMRLRSLNS